MFDIPHTTTRVSAPVAAALAVLGGLGLAASAAAVPQTVEVGARFGSLTTKANPPLPSLAVFPVQLVLDDDSAEGSFGLDGRTARQFMWLNRFATPGAAELEEIWVLFPAEPDVPLGGAVQLAVFLDPDGDPMNGADLLATYDVTVQATDGNTFSVYPLGVPVGIPAGGDVLIGVINRYFTAGVDPPPTRPVALDTTASQGRSYLAFWAADPPDPPDLATASSVSLLEGAVAANLMIRAFGVAAPVVDIPSLGGVGLAGLAALLAVAGLCWLRP